MSVFYSLIPKLKLGQNNSNKELNNIKIIAVNIGNHSKKIGRLIKNNLNLFYVENGNKNINNSRVIGHSRIKA